MMSSQTAGPDRPSTSAPVNEAYSPTRSRKTRAATSCNTSWCLAIKRERDFFVMFFSREFHDFDMPTSRDQGLTRPLTEEPDVGGVSDSTQEMGPVVLEFVDRLVHIGQRGVLLVLLEAVVHLGAPALGQLLEGAHVEAAVVKVRLQLGHVLHQKAPVLADGVATHGRTVLRDVFANEGQQFGLRFFLIDRAGLHFVDQAAATVGALVPVVHGAQY